MSKTSESKAAKKKEKKADKPKRVTGQNAGPQGFLVEHGEKIAFGAFALVVILCLVGALGHESYKKTPEQLASALQQKRTAVTQNTSDSFAPLKEEGLIPGAYGELALGSTAPVPPEERLPTTGTPRTGVEIMQKRGETEYRPLEGLMAYPINEALAMLADGKKKAERPKPAPKEKAKPEKKDRDLLGAVGVPGAKGGKKPKPPGPGGKLGDVPMPGKVPDVMGPAPAHDYGSRGGVQAPDAESKVFPGVLLVGRIPRKKQVDLYLKQFESARDYDQVRDTPHYVSFFIERSQDGGQTWEQTVTVNTPKGPKTMTFAEAYAELKFATDFPEVVDTSLGDYILPFVVVGAKEKDAKEGDEEKVEESHRGFAISPLPPILGRDWPDIVAGGFPVRQAEPKLGFPAGGAGGGPVRPGAGPGVGVPPGVGPGAGGGVRPGAGAVVPPGVGPGAAGPPGGGPKLPGGPGAIGPPGAGAPQPGRPGVGQPPQVGQVVPGGPGVGGPGVGGPRPGPPGGNVRPGGGNPGFNPNLGPNRPEAGPRDVGLGQVQADKNCDFLFRFFDFTVEEGKTYQYRVAIKLENPNFGLSEGLLKDIRLREGKYRYSPFTDPTQPVRVSIAGSEIVAGPVRGARLDAGQADSATVIVRQRHRQSGSIVAHTFNRMEAGQVLNLKALKVKYEKAVGGVAEAELPEFDFASDELIVDVKGSGDKGWPGEMLLLDADGRLTVRKEVPTNTAGAKTADGRTLSTAASTSVPIFAAEAKRLEYIYNYQPPQAAGVGAGPANFGDLLAPMGKP